MNIMWLRVASLLSVTAAVSAHNIRAFPAGNHTVAGVFQVSSMSSLGQPQYAFNASEARTLCESLGVDIASKAQVQEALLRGLETCRFGWVDEHFAVIPRITALSNCGQNQTGLVTWRAAVTQKFDVFCFNESDKTAQQEAATTGLPSESTSVSSPSSSPTTNPSLTTSMSFLDELLSRAEQARFVGGAPSSSGGKAVLITSCCSLLLLAVIIIAYVKVKRRSGSSDVKQQENMETEEWTSEKNMKEPGEAAGDEERIEVGDTAS